MRSRLILVFLLLSINVHAQNMHAYFERIRNNASELTAFFAAMPKGGDLHHHYSGSVYAETFFNNALDSNFYLNRLTLQISKKDPGKDANWVSLENLQQENSFFDYKQRVLRKWSAMDYQPSDYPSHRQFFESFEHFGAASEFNYDKGLLELKRRAKAEHVSYIETMYRTIDCTVNIDDPSANNERFRVLQNSRQSAPVQRLLDSIYTCLKQKNVATCANLFNAELEKLHRSLAIDDAGFTMRYQAFVLRFFEPVQIFKDMVVAFESANNSLLVVGVNIVAPEHHDIAMQDYWLHMQMFRYLHEKYPNVKYSLHAGELTLGLVKPEEMNWHINAAVHDAKANRIGHGVDIAYEANAFALLDHMHKSNIPVEINLYSNEFILEVKDDRHPIMLYKKHKVPIVISTDDEGVLRTNLIEQYVLLAKRYPRISYADIKQFVYNSIEYSFIEEPSLKKQIKATLDRDFMLFEKMIKNSSTFK